MNPLEQEVPASAAPAAAAPDATMSGLWQGSAAHAVVRVGIVDDHTIVRTALKQFLAEQENLRVVGEAANGRDAISMVRRTRMDVLLLDLSMPGQGGLDVLATIRAKAPDLGILILSAYPKAQYAVPLLRRGADGYLEKDCDPPEIARAIRMISLGRRYISPAVAQLLADDVIRRRAVETHELLSDREFQVFLRLAKGERPPQIAQALCLSAKTVSTYRTRLLQKLHVVTNSDLTYYALKHALLD